MSLTNYAERLRGFVDSYEPLQDRGLRHTELTTTFPEGETIY